MSIPESAKQFYYQHVTDTPTPAVSGLTSAAEVQAHSTLPWLPLKLPFEVPHEAMLKEAEQLYECFVPHTSQSIVSGEWSSLCLHGLSSVHTAHHKDYGFATSAEAPYGWTDLCKVCPVSHRFFMNFGYKVYHRIRLMLLRPGGYYMPHSDTIENHLDAINIALNQPPKCDFVMAGAGIVPFVPGQANLMSVSRRHMVWNQSDENRYHIIVLGMRDPLVWDEIIMDSYTSL